MSFNVLIVDDSGSMRAVIKKIIGLSGFRMDQCFEAGNGREALEVVGGNWVDVVISDINMPEMDGLEMLRKMKADRLLKDIPVIIITTVGDENRMQTVYGLGAKGFIKKPFLPEDVKKELHKVMGVRDEGQLPKDPGNADPGDF